MKIRVPNPRYITARHIMRQLEDLNDPVDPVTRRKMKRQLRNVLITHITNPEFNTVIGDQMSRLAPLFLDDDDDDTSPTVSSEKAISPMEPTRAAASIPEHHDIFTDDEGVHESDEPAGPSLDTESNIGRITKIREDVEELNMKFTTILPKMLKAFRSP